MMDAIQNADKRMQYLMKNPPLLSPLGALIAPFCQYLPIICKEIMAKRLAKRRCMKFRGNFANIELAFSPLWVHMCDLQLLCGCKTE